MKRIVLGGRGLVTGAGSLKYLSNLKGKKFFIVTGGKSLFNNGTIEKIENIIKDLKGETFIFKGIKKNPDTDIVLKGLEEMNKFNPDTVIAVGGGSPMDAAKVMTIMYENKEINFHNILERQLPNKREKIQFIAIPSTSGTASEVTKAAVVTFKDKDLKIGLKTDAFIPDIAILDSDIVMSMPQNIVAETGMDAVTHAVECYINKSLDDFTEVIAKGAVEGLFKYLPISYKEATIESREKVHNYQSMAGIAFANVGLGMAHGISHSIGGRFNLGHGLCNAIALPYVLEYNSKDREVKEKLNILAKTIGVKDFIEEVRNLNNQLNVPNSLKDVFVDEMEFKKDFEKLVENSLKGSTKSNPVRVSKEDMEKILKALYYGTKLSI